MADSLVLAGNSALTAWPKAAVSTAVFRGTDVLLIQRARGTFAGNWSLPGGHIEFGEQVRSAALREVLEETAITARLLGLVDVMDVMVGDGDGKRHYVLTVFSALWLSGVPHARSDAAAARFVPLSEIERYPLTPGAAGVINKAAGIATVYPVPVAHAHHAQDKRDPEPAWTARNPF